jgi:hypothetical protein
MKRREMTFRDSAPDLRRWDFQKSFSAFEIACLIQGIDPLANSTIWMKTTPSSKELQPRIFIRFVY